MSIRPSFCFPPSCFACFLQKSIVSLKCTQTTGCFRMTEKKCELITQARNQPIAKTGGIFRSGSSSRSCKTNRLSDKKFLKAITYSLLLLLVLPS